MSSLGRLEAICIAHHAGAPMQALEAVEAVEAIAGQGLAGDRYLAGTGFYSTWPTTAGAREVTLLAAETLDWLEASRGIRLRPVDHRRNLTVRGLALEALIGQRFRVGEVLLEGVRDCPPCEHLEALTGLPVLRPLVGRGGLRARVLRGGTLRVGDVVERMVPAADGAAVGR